MINESISRKEDDIDIIPSQSLDLLSRGRYHVCVILLHSAKIGIYERNDKKAASPM